MIPRSENDMRFRVVGIDPGTETTGYSVLDLSLEDGSITVTSSETLRPNEMLKDYKFEEEVHGARTARLMALEDRLFVLFELTQPHAICTESPFLGRFPQAFAALTECVSYVRRAVCRFDRHKPLESVDPPTAKKAVGVKVKRGITKDDVKAAILCLDLKVAEGIDLSTLDEHSLDSIAVAYHQVLLIREQIFSS